MAVSVDIERAARVIAAFEGYDWSGLTERAQDDYRRLARHVVEAVRNVPQVDAAYEAVRIDPTTDRDRWDIFDEDEL